MSEFKGTPGPWEASRGADQVMYIDCPDGDRDLGHAAWFGMAIVYGCSEMGISGHKKAVANASLMAAAPDLLGVLQEVQEMSVGWSEYEVPIGIHDRINAAIAKALGEDHAD